MYPSFAISEMETCIQNCIECHNACLAMVPYCLSTGRDHSTPHHVSTLLACAEICQTTANLMLMDSPLHGYMCGIAAAACKRCAEECERVGQDDEQMLACAETCRQCFHACRSMANAA